MNATQSATGRPDTFALHPLEDIGKFHTQQHAQHRPISSRLSSKFQLMSLKYDTSIVMRHPVENAPMRPPQLQGRFSPRAETPPRPQLSNRASPIISGPR